MPHPAIENYALIGDTRSAALISNRGSIDWLCWPRFDSPSLFARLLDDERGGHFSIHPEGEFESTRRYVDATNVLETTFTCSSGAARLIDLMPVMRESEKRRRLTPFRQLLRRVECVEGEVALVVTYAPRPNFARDAAKLESRDDRVHLSTGTEVLNLRSEVKFAIDGDTAIARFTLRAGERRDFALGFDDHTPAVFPLIGDGASEEIERTLAFWREWSAQLDYDGPHRDLVERSALVLKLMAYAPSGAIVAAPTTSLPEKIGGVRNWDYRYCWLRDASFTAGALYDCGFQVEGTAFVNWLCYATQLTQPRLSILYDVFGEAHLPEEQLDHLAGYRGSRPVRIGNDAHAQLQLDVYGEVLGAIDEYAQRGEPLTRDIRRLIYKLSDFVAAHWQEPDSGIWEKRSERQHHVHAKVMAWSALDTAERLTKDKRWSSAKDQIRRVVFDRGFNREMNSFVSLLDGNELDASLLYMSRVAFIEPDDPRMLSTIDAIRTRLGRGDLLYRYEITTADGLPPGEGAFVPCSFWLVEALGLAGRKDEAHALFETLLARANDVGLFAEEIDVESGAFLGNFPQALTHIALMNAALCLNKKEESRSQRAASGARKTDR